MTAETVLQQLNEIFKSVLGQDDIQLSPTTTALDVDGWDSLSHVMLVVEIEKQFKKTFKTREIVEWKCVGDIITSILRG